MWKVLYWYFSTQKKKKKKNPLHQSSQMQKTLKLSYSELLYLVAHCSWMLQAKYYFSIPFMCVPLLFLSFFATIYPLFLSSVSSPLLSPTLITHAISPLAPTVLPLSWTTELSLHDAPNPSLTFRFSLSLSLSLSHMKCVQAHFTLKKWEGGILYLSAYWNSF